MEQAKEGGITIAKLEQKVNSSLEAKLNEQFQYIRFAFSDINGISRGKIATINHAIKYLKKGMAFFCGRSLYGSQFGHIPAQNLVLCNLPQAKKTDKINSK